MHRSSSLIASCSLALLTSFAHHSHPSQNSAPNLGPQHSVLSASASKPSAKVSANLRGTWFKSKGFVGVRCAALIPWASPHALEQVSAARLQTLQTLTHSPTSVFERWNPLGRPVARIGRLQGRSNISVLLSLTFSSVLDCPGSTT